MIQGRPPWGRLHIFLGGVGAFGAYILLVVVAVGGCRGWWGDNAPAALHKVGGEGNGACGAYMLFLFCHAGRVGAFGATYCLWLVVVGGCRGWWGDNAPLALHKVGGRQGRLRRLHVFLFFWAPLALHIACGCRGWWLSRLVGGQCACGATQCWWGAMAPAAPTCFFVFLGAFGGAYCW